MRAIQLYVRGVAEAVVESGSAAWQPEGADENAFVEVVEEADEAAAAS